jgi:predicted CoA-binding protein
MINKKTLVIGASTKPERYSNQAIRLLRRYDYPVEAIGLRSGQVAGIEFKTGFPELNQIHTIAMYVGQSRQPQYYDYLLGLKPKRIIFNPGTENDEFSELLEEQGVEVVEHCTLVMLNSGLF